MTQASFPAFRARYNQTRTLARKIYEDMSDANAKDVGAVHLAELRDMVVDLNQCFHEANAYHNAIGHGAKKD